MTLVRLGNREFSRGRHAYQGVDDMFNWFMNEAPAHGTFNDYPSANILESDDDFKIEMRVPGYKKENIRLQVENGVLSISHRSDESDDNEAVKYVSREFQNRNFVRRFKLSDRLAAEKIEAKYENGILMISIPKQEEAKAKPVMEISIS